MFGSSFLFNWFLDSGWWVVLWFCGFGVFRILGLWGWNPGVSGSGWVVSRGVAAFVGLHDIISGSRFGCFCLFCLAI